jgi:two-component system alkaline phosphatase synthesis response regulator PhoP
MRERLLLVEDERALQKTLTARLQKAGYVVEAATDGIEGFEKAVDNAFDLILLDLALPLRDGFDVCRDLRQAGIATPILILTARSQTTDKVVGLKLGADDYVTKPFSAAELMARIEALLRRVQVRTGHGMIEIGPIRLNMRRMEVTRDANPIYLTVREFQLLRYLMERAGSTVPRTELLRSVWGYDSGSFTRTVDVHIASLRKKIEKDPASPELILTVSSSGYKFAR